MTGGVDTERPAARLPSPRGVARTRGRTRRLRWALTRVLPFGAIWVAFGVVFLFSEYAATDGFRLSPPDQIRPDAVILAFALTVLFALGCAVGALELFVLRARFAALPYWLSIAARLGIYVVVFDALIVVGFLATAAMEGEGAFGSDDAWARLLSFGAGVGFWSAMLQLSVSLVASLFYAEMADSHGSGYLRRLFTGYYHEPREERRVFLFVDMRSSTTLTERLGHAQYFRLLRRYLRDLSAPILECGGEVYQYVGDEVIVSWRHRAGAEEEALACYVEMRHTLDRLATDYERDFGVCPRFKAALHAGEVTVGEVGLLKRDLAFTGDVLNATARMQALCGPRGVDVVFSGLVRDALGSPWRERAVPLGAEVLRGQSAPVELYSLAT